jgi:3-hydroxymyristoyl/3-hydroxydecanoyl-(acyl carrier protein) dehydratase
VTAAGLPLLAARDLASPLAWRNGAAIGSGQFIAEAQVLAERLPASGRPLNLCQDRYHFALGLAAALLRGQTSLMPPNALPETLRQAPPDGAAPYVMSDDPASGAGELPVLRIERPPGVAPAREVPLLPASLQAVCLLTSGSTGAPQPHARRWGPLVANVRAEAERLAELMARPSIAGLNVVATVPAQHSYGLESTVLLAWLGGAAFDAGRPFYPADIAEALARLPRPRALVTTPFHLKTLLLSGVALPGVDLVLSATAPLSPQLAATAEAAFGGLLAEIYGCTEAGQVAARRTTAGETWTTLGELRITHDPGSGPDNERWIVAGGHVVEPTPLADVLELQAPRDGRQFRLLGRANDLIHVAGKRSSLAHLNFHLNRIEGVEDGAFWLPDDEAEGVVRPVAFVVAPTLTPRQVIGALRAQLEPAFVPRRVVQVAALPREATGKLTAAALRRFALQALAAAAAADPGSGPSGCTEFEIPADHPAFAGHFPGRPVLPGAVLLSLVLEALERQPALRSRLGPHPSIDSAKFLAPVGPGARLVAQLRGHGSGVAFEVHQHGIAVARGQLSAGVAA